MIDANQPSYCVPYWYPIYGNEGTCQKYKNGLCNCGQPCMYPQGRKTDFINFCEYDEKAYTQTKLCKDTDILPTIQMPHLTPYVR
jgi:hypothetical protein